MRFLLSLFFLQLICFVPSFAKPRLYVYLPTEAIRARPLEQILTRVFEGEVIVKTFARYSEIKGQMSEFPPDAILSLAPVCEHFMGKGDYEVILTGVKGNLTTEPYVLMYNEAEGLKAWDEMTVGFIRMFGRRELTQYMTKTFDEPQSITWVSKLEDMLSLLQFKEADAILIAQSKIEYFNKRSELSLAVKETGKSLGLATLILKTESPENKKILLEAFRKISEKRNLTLGVESWKEP